MTPLKLGGTHSTLPPLEVGQRAAVWWQVLAFGVCKKWASNGQIGRKWAGQAKCGPKKISFLHIGHFFFGIFCSFDFLTPSLAQVLILGPPMGQHFSNPTQILQSLSWATPGGRQATPCPQRPTLGGGGAKLGGLEHHQSGGGDPGAQMAISEEGNCAREMGTLDWGWVWQSGTEGPCFATTAPRRPVQAGGVPWWPRRTPRGAVMPISGPRGAACSGLAVPEVARIWIGMQPSLSAQAVALRLARRLELQKCILGRMIGKNKW